MNMQELTTETLGKVLEYVEQTKDFALTQAPLLCEEIIKWGIAKALIWVVFALFVGASSAYIFNRCRTWAIKHNEEEAEAVSFFVMLAVPFVCSVVFACNILVIAQAYFAPRLFIIEYITDLM